MPRATLAEALWSLSFIAADLASDDGKRSKSEMAAYKRAYDLISDMAVAEDRKRERRLLKSRAARRPSS